MRREMSSIEEAEALGGVANCGANHLEYTSLVLWRQPLKTVKYSSLELLDVVAGLGSRLLGRRLLFSLSAIAIVVMLYVIPGPHSSYMQVWRTNLGFVLYWLGLGFLSSVGFGTGLHTFLLYMGPHIVGVTLAAYECQTLEFPVPPYPDQAICPKEPYVRYSPSTWQIMSKVRPETIFCSLGSVLGELPLYFMARAARLSGKWLNGSSAEASEPTPPRIKTLFERIKGLLERVVLRTGFIGILLCASIPNPLFDLAGVVCGHFLVPFWKFFIATLIGKAIIKSNIQQMIVIIAFTEDQLSFQELLDCVKQHMHGNGAFKGFSLASTEGAFSGFRLVAHLFQLLSFIILVYYLTSLMHILAQRRCKRNQLRKAQRADMDTKIDGIVEI